MFKKILIANRGEIALRVMRTCREMGIRTVAVYSEADRTAPHVLFADEAYPIGPAPSTESYLRYETILEVAARAEAEAIHPGYGFLSENTTFAEAITQAGITFIGPSAEAIQIMGDKTTARARMESAGVPVVPGSEAPIEDPEQALATAEEIGFPVLIKAAGGGGGKGMRIVDGAKSFVNAVSQAQREAGSAFGDARVYIEKYLEEPHHIEFQILADQHGTVLHLGERECSIQRRYQKVIEESPSPFLRADERAEMGAAAVEAARSCGYLGAGTVEFLMDANHQFYFLEMNTRLQVEHPVTEMVTGIDLVAEQIRIAAGEALAFDQEDITFSGHAVECRVYAEDSQHDFAPSVGEIKMLQVPDGAGTRFDGALRQGLQVTPYYDPMLGKLICWGRTREDALNRMHRALSEFFIGGVQTTIHFCQAVINHPRFREGHYDTHFYQEHGAELTENITAQSECEVLAASAALLTHQASRQNARAAENADYNPSQWVRQHRRSR